MLNDIIIKHIKKFIHELSITDYTGIIVYGSYVGKRTNRLSDLDIMVIKDNYETQDCGSIMIDGIRVEYFIQGLNKLYELIKKELDNNDPSHLTKFATCEIVCDTDNKVFDFINYAKLLYNTKIVPTFNDLERFSIFSINNRIEDLEALLNNDSFYSVYYVTLEKIRTLFSKINGIIELPIMKCEDIYRNPDFAKKYLSSSIHLLPDQCFIDFYLKCLKIDDKITMLNNIKELFRYTIKDLDFNPNSFCLKFTRNAPFKV